VIVTEKKNGHGVKKWWGNGGRKEGTRKEGKGEKGERRKLDIAFVAIKKPPPDRSEEVQRNTSFGGGIEKKGEKKTFKRGKKRIRLPVNAVINERRQPSRKSKQTNGGGGEEKRRKKDSFCHHIGTHVKRPEDWGENCFTLVCNL